MKNLSYTLSTLLIATHSDNFPFICCQGWIACGGDAGLLKVLKLEQAAGPDAQIGVRSFENQLSSFVISAMLYFFLGGGGI